MLAGRSSTGVAIQPAADLLDDAGSGGHASSPAPRRTRSPDRSTGRAPRRRRRPGRNCATARPCRGRPSSPAGPRRCPRSAASTRSTSASSARVISRATWSVLRVAGRPQHPHAAVVRALPDVPVAGAGAGHPDPVVQPGVGDRRAQHLLADRRPADVAGADHADVEPGVGRRDRAAELTGSLSPPAGHTANRRRREVRTARLRQQCVTAVRDVIATVLAAYPARWPRTGTPGSG